MVSQKKFKKRIIEFVIIFLVIILAYFFPNTVENIWGLNNQQTQPIISYDITSIPEYNGKTYVVINNNIPNFDQDDYTTKSFEKYSKLDSKFGRCGVAYANISKETMPSKNEERESIT